MLVKGATGRPEVADIGGHDWSLFWVGSSGCMVGWYMPSDDDVPGKTCPTCLWSVSPAGTSSQASTSYLTHWSSCCSRCRQIERLCTAPSPACQYGSTGRGPIPHLHIPGLVWPRCCRPCPWSHENSRIDFVTQEVQGPVGLGGRSLNVFSPVLVPVPLTGFRSNSKFDQNLECSNLKCTQPITMIFCTRHDSYIVVTYAKLRCNRLSIF